MAEYGGEKREINRKLVLQALTDPDFRRKLEAEPQEILGIREFSTQNKLEIRFVLAAVKAIEAQIAGLADELLCANGGPCGIA